MAKGHTKRQEARRTGREDKKQERKTPVPADQAANMRAGEGRVKEVAETLTRLGGSSRDDLTSDKERGGASPLGHGTGSKKRKS